MPEELRHSYRKTIIAWALVFVVAAASAIGYWSWYKWQESLQVQDAAQSVVTGDFQDAIAKASDFIAAHKPGDKYYVDAHILLEVGNFWSNSPEGRKAAIRLAKQQFIAAAGDPVAQANIANRILGYMQSNDPAVGAEVFSTEPFQKYLVKNDVLASMKNVAEFSLQQFRSSTPLLQVAQWHAAELIKSRDGVTTLSAAETAAHVAAIRDALSEADQLYERESEYMQDKAFYDLYKQSFFFTRGYLFGVLSLYDNSHVSAMRSSFQLVEDAYSLSRIAEASMLKTRLPFAHLQSALFLSAIDSTGNEKEIAAHLDSMMQEITKNPANHERFFAAYMRAVPTFRTNVGLWPSEERIKELAALNASFNDYLKQLGWTL